MIFPGVRYVLFGATRPRGDRQRLSLLALRHFEDRIQVVGLIQGVNLDQGNSCGAVQATEDRRVIARGEIFDNRRFQVIRRRDACRDDFAFLIAPPVVIRSDQRAVRVS